MSMYVGDMLAMCVEILIMKENKKKKKIGQKYIPQLNNTNLLIIFTFTLCECFKFYVQAFV